MSDKLCMGCMNALPDDAETCPVCGYPAGGENPSQYLPVNTLLSDRYLVGRVLDVGCGGGSFIAMMLKRQKGKQ